MTAEMFGESQTSPDGSTPRSGGDGPSTKDAAKEQARGVAQQGVEGGKHVAAVASNQAKDVVAEAAQQARTLLGQAKQQLKEQTSTQQSRIAEQLHALSAELGSMASTSEQDGPASNLASQASRQLGSAAHWLSEREPETLVTELKGFARNKPGTFMCIAAGIGLFAGRMTRGARAGAPDSTQGAKGREIDSQGYDPQSYRPAPATLETGYPATERLTTPTRTSDGLGQAGQVGQVGQGIGTPYPAPGTEIIGEGPDPQQPFVQGQTGQSGQTGLRP